MRIFVHAGHLSLDNGAYAPLTVFSDLAKAIGISPDWGQHYGFDSIDVPPSDWPVVEEMLKEAKLLYRVDGVHQIWQNAQSDYVRGVLSRVTH